MLPACTPAHLEVDGPGRESRVHEISHQRPSGARTECIRRGAKPRYKEHVTLPVRPHPVHMHVQDVVLDLQFGRVGMHAAS